MLGSIDEVKCKANRVKAIDRNICKNNCKQWDRQKRKCILGYK